MKRRRRRRKRKKKRSNFTTKLLQKMKRTNKQKQPSETNVLEIILYNFLSCLDVKNKVG
jgi:hypothetical protein